LLAALRIYFFKREKKKGKKRKEKAVFQAGEARLSRFLEKILPEGWRFFYQTGEANPCSSRIRTPVTLLYV